MPVTTAVCTPVASRSVSPALSTTASTASTAVTTARTRIARTSMGFSFGWGSGAEGAGDHAGDTTSHAAHGDSSESDTSQPVLDRFELVDPGLQLDHVGPGDLVVELGVHFFQLLPDLPEDVPQRIGDGRLAHPPRALRTMAAATSTWRALARRATNTACM